jgi:hypothetical protein
VNGFDDPRRAADAMVRGTMTITGSAWDAVLEW